MEETKTFEIHIDDLAVDSGAVPVRWCLNREMAEKVATGEACVLIVVQSLVRASDYPYKRHEARQVHALGDLMAYVSFTRPGRNRISAFLVASSVKKAKGYFLKRVDGRQDRQFNMAIFDAYMNPDDAGYCTLRRGSYHVEAMASHDVDVPKEIFAPEPPEWEKRWVNLWHESTPVDQCAFRKRRILAYTLKPFAFAVAFIARYLMQICRVLWLVLLATRGDYWKVLRYPSMSVDLYECGAPGSLYGSAKPHLYGATSPVSLARVAFSPFVILASIFISYKVFDGGWFLLGAVALPLAGLLVSLVMLIADMVMDKRKQAWRVRDLPNKLARLTKEDLGYLTCDIAPGTASLASLPMRRRTIRLHLQEIKRKVCRPFAG